MGIIEQGLILMATGMLAVFVFLLVLLYVMKGVAAFAPKLSFMLPDPEPAKPAAKPQASDDAAIAVAIAAAMKRRGSK